MRLTYYSNSREDSREFFYTYYFIFIHMETQQDEFQNQADGFCEVPNEVVERILTEQAERMARYLAQQEEPMSHGV